MMEASAPYRRIWEDQSLGRVVTSGHPFRIERKDWQWLIALFVATRAIIAFGIIAAYLSNTSRMETGLDDLFCNWDCDWYSGIAENGYQSLDAVSASGAANWVFFPLFPILIHLLSAITGLRPSYSGLLIAQASWGLGLYLMYLAARDLKGPEFARHAATIYAVWPFAIHGSMPMTEALFVPLTIAIFLFARRTNWLIVAMLVPLLSATRTVGVMIELPLFMLASEQFGVWRVLTLRPGTERAVLALASAGLGIALFMVYLYGLTGDALAFSHNQAAWKRHLEAPWMMILDELNPAIISPAWLLANSLDIATCAVAIVLLVFLWRRGLWAEVAYALVVVTIACCTGNASSLPRYAGGLYPVMLAFALWSQGPLHRVPTYAALTAGLAALSVAWGLEQFYVM